MERAMYEGPRRTLQGAGKRHRNAARASTDSASPQSGRIAKKLLSIYRALFSAYGPQHWWPGDTPFEVMVGAVLTQNTAWNNVEKAVVNLKQKRLLTPSSMAAVPEGRLAELIRPSGYYNIKARRLKHLVEFLMEQHGGSLKRMFSDEPESLRRSILRVNGIGPETADSILLYAGELPFFVVDAYTKRILSRHELAVPDAEYHDIQRLFMDHLSRDPRMYNEYHALLVRVGKEHCTKSSPLCSDCPLRTFLRKKIPCTL